MTNSTMFIVACHAIRLWKSLKYHKDYRLVQKCIEHHNAVKLQLCEIAAML